MKKGPRFQLREAVKILDLPGQTIKNWAAQGVIAPTGAPTGTGTRRLYATDDLVAIALVDHCRILFGDEIRPRTLARRIQRAVKEADLPDLPDIPDDSNLVLLLYRVPRGMRTAGEVQAKVMSLDEVQPFLEKNVSQKYGRFPIYTILGLRAVISQIRERVR